MALLCLLRLHRTGSSSRTVVDQSGAFRLDVCERCDRVISTRRLDPSEVCEVLGHDLTGDFDDRILKAARSEITGELVELELVRAHVCTRCKTTIEKPIPPELVPADVFERIEKQLEERVATTAVESIDLDLGSK